MMWVCAKSLAKCKRYATEFQLVQELLVTANLPLRKRGEAWDRLLLLSERYVQDDKSVRMQSTLTLAAMALADDAVAPSVRKSIVQRV